MTVRFKGVGLRSDYQIQRTSFPSVFRAMFLPPFARPFEFRSAVVARNPSTEKGTVFPGFLGDMTTVGSGVTLRLGGVGVLASSLYPQPFSGLLQAREAVTQLYISRGYVTSGAIIPDQTAADGVVVGSAIVDRIARHGKDKDLAKKVGRFVRPMVKAVKQAT